MNYNDYHPDDLRRIIKECQVALSRKEDRSTKFIKENPKSWKLIKSDKQDYTVKSRTWRLLNDRNKTPYSEEDNYIFQATLIPISTTVFKDCNDKRYCVKPSTLFEMVEACKNNKLYFNGEGFQGLYTYANTGPDIQGNLHTIIYKGK